MKRIGRLGQSCAWSGRPGDMDGDQASAISTTRNRAIRIIAKCPAFRAVIDYRIGPSPAAASSRCRHSRSLGPSCRYSTYLPEHMGSIRLTPSGPFVAGSHAELTLIYTAGHVRHRRHRHGEDLLAHHVRHEQAAIRQAGGARTSPRSRRATAPSSRSGSTVSTSGPTRTRCSSVSAAAICAPAIRSRSGLATAGRARPAIGCRPIARSASSSRPRSTPSPPTNSASCPSSRRSISCRDRRRRWKAIWPSLAVVGEPFRLAHRRRGHVGQSDRRGGADAHARAVAAGARLARERSSIKRGDGPRVIENLVADAPAISSCALMADGKEVARANPLRVVAAAPLRRYWGDLHGQSGETIGMGSAESYFRYARDAAFIDMVGHQGNDFQITDAFWAEAQPAHRGIRRAGPLRLPARLRMVGQHRHGRRPQHLLPPRRPPDPPLVAHPGRGPDLDRRDLHRRRAVSRAPRRGRRRHRPCRRPLRRPQICP